LNAKTASFQARREYKVLQKKHNVRSSLKMWDKLFTLDVK